MVEHAVSIPVTTTMVIRFLDIATSRNASVSARRGPSLCLTSRTELADASTFASSRLGALFAQGGAGLFRKMRDGALSFRRTSGFLDVASRCRSLLCAGHLDRPCQTSSRIQEAVRTAPPKL